MQLVAHGSELWAHQFQTSLDGLLTTLLLVEGAHLSAPFVIKEGRFTAPGQWALANSLGLRTSTNGPFAA